MPRSNNLTPQLLELHQSSSLSDPLSQPSSYASAISPKELLSASRSSMAIALLTTYWRFLTLNATVVSIDKDVFIASEEEDVALANMWGKLSSRGYGKGVLVLQKPLGE